jgi:hypothetical protein
MIDKKNVIALLNEKLSESNIKLLEDKILSEWNLVQQHFEKRLNEYASIKIVLLGEATVNVENYILNTDSEITTSFLEPNHFGMKSKKELNDFLINKGIFPFDLYAVPLPTLIYDNIKFKFKDKTKQELYITHLTEHFNQLKNKLGDNSAQLIMRYTKLKKRLEWKIFKEYFDENFKNSCGESDSDILDISNNIRASEAKILKHFGHLITAYNHH